MESLRPGITSGDYPERTLDGPPEFSAFVTKDFVRLYLAARTRRRFKTCLPAIKRYASQYATKSEEALRDMTGDLRQQLHRRGLEDDLIARSFALVRETAGRTLGMRHFDTQLQGGWALVCGTLAEMETGEGKTLTATLAAATAALGSIPVHVITVNDYLARRDLELMAPLYRALGLRVGVAATDTPPQARQEAYRCDITYCTAKQLAFDYLRDRILLGKDHGRMRVQLERLHSDKPRADTLLLRGLCFAIIDEADSILIDEARTPLIISREKQGADESPTYRQAAVLAGRLQPDIDYHINVRGRRIELLAHGAELLADEVKELGGPWQVAAFREEMVCRAVAATTLYKRDRHYLIQDGRVVIIDENTGRTMADRTWERGLQQMIELKEDCPLTGPREHIARSTYQRFFRRFLRISGMTGTAHEVRRELWSVYRLPVLKIPTNKPVQRHNQGYQIHRNQEEKWRAIISRIIQLHNHDRPVLVGTRSVADSEHLSAMLEETGLRHTVLNARHDRKEAEIVAGAGQRAAITIATNMAGRGTDIPLGEGVAERGGLHIISCECNESARIDRQLFGRCGRQGDPGSYEQILCTEDELMQKYLPRSLQKILTAIITGNLPFAQVVTHRCMSYAQVARERQDKRLRRNIMKQEEQLGRLISYSGGLE